MGQVFDDARFLPYLQRHELEALVLGSLGALQDMFDADEDLRGIKALEEEIGDQGPEDVNDGQDSAPSKRLKRHLPGYRKALHGPMAIEDAGLASVRARCPRFDRWVTRLEEMSPEKRA